MNYAQFRMLCNDLLGEPERHNVASHERCFKKLFVGKEIPQMVTLMRKRVDELRSQGLDALARRRCVAHALLQMTMEGSHQEAGRLIIHGPQACDYGRGSRIDEGAIQTDDFVSPALGS